MENPGPGHVLLPDDCAGLPVESNKTGALRVPSPQGCDFRLDVSVDAPYLDCAYKLVEYAGRPRRKRSEGKASWPGRKQVYRTCDGDQMSGDVITLDDDDQRGEPLIRAVMKDGHRLEPPDSLSALRQRAAAQLARLPRSLKSLDEAAPYRVQISPAVKRLAEKTHG